MGGSGVQEGFPELRFMCKNRILVKMPGEPEQESKRTGVGESQDSVNGLVTTSSHVHSLCGS